MTDPAKLLRELVGTDPRSAPRRSRSSSGSWWSPGSVSALATSGVAVLDLAAHQHEIANRSPSSSARTSSTSACELPRFVIENVSLPPEVEAAMDKRTQMGVLGDLDRFTRYQAATAITEAAANPGGLAGAGVGVGVGASLGAQLAQALAPGGHAHRGTDRAAAAAGEAPSGTSASTASRSARWPRPRSRRG